MHGISRCVYINFLTSTYIFSSRIISRISMTNVDANESLFRKLRNFYFLRKRVRGGIIFTDVLYVLSIIKRLSVIHFCRMIILKNSICAYKRSWCICTQHANVSRVCICMYVCKCNIDSQRVLEYSDLSAFSVGVLAGDLIYNVLRTWHLFDKWQSLYSRRNCRKLGHSSRARKSI